MKWWALASLTLIAACQPKPQSVEAVRAAPAAGPTAKTLKIQAHRGGRGVRPENTLPAFEAALDLEVDVLELDVQLTRDGKIIVWHDPYVFAANCRHRGPIDGPAPSTATSRPSLTRANPLAVPVVDPDSLPMLHPALAVANQRAEQLRGLRCDRNPSPDKFPDQKPTPGAVSGDDFGIVQLDELFDFVQRYSATKSKTPSQRSKAKAVHFNIELKRSEKYPSFIADAFDGTEPARFERALREVLDRRDYVDRTTVQSFDHRALWAFSKLGPITLSVLQLDGEQQFASWAERGAKIWSPSHALVDAGRVARAHRHGLEVIPWTVNDVTRARMLIEAGVDGLITDRPDLLVGLRGSP